MIKRIKLLESVDTWFILLWVGLPLLAGIIFLIARALYLGWN